MIDRIQVRPDVHFGKPCVVGTRILVQSVLELVERGLSFQTIIKDYYPDLTEGDVQACVHHAVALVACDEIHLVDFSNLSQATLAKVWNNSEDTVYDDL